MFQMPAKQTFRHPAAVWVVVGILTAVFAGLTLVCALQTLPPREKWTEWFPVLVGLALVGAMAYTTWTALDRIDIDEVGISFKRCGFHARTFCWSSLRQVRESTWGKILELHGLPDEPVFKISYEVPGFERLFEIIMTVAAVVTAPHPELVVARFPVTIRRRREEHWLWLGLCVLMFAFGLIPVTQGWNWRKATLGMVLGVGFGSLFLYCYAEAWMKLTVADDRILLRGLLRAREIPFILIQDISVFPVRSNATYVCLHLYLQLTNGETLDLHEFQGRTLAAAEAIKGARRQWLEGIK